ncbi:hypothetical protein [Saccharothrix sp.]|uniref:hypothetical protein n=1 Tax=Saccharothrix sp. TaxID=1873460 RepID=UPI0028109EEC|nr:hypothetical protein [Saccharothrix sp.]
MTSIGGVGVMPSTSSPAQQAVLLHRHLLSSGSLQPCMDPLPHGVGLYEAGETLLGVFGRAEVGAYHRFYSEPVTRTGGPLVLTTDPRFATGFVLGTAARRMFSRSGGSAWHARTLVTTAVTTRRLWCLVAESDGAATWRWFNFDNVTHLELHGDRMTAQFVGATPLRLAGPWAPWCAVILAHYGPRIHAASVLSERRGVLRAG